MYGGQSLMYSLQYPEMVRNMMQARVIPRMAEALRSESMTERELSHHLGVSQPLIKLALSHLRAKGYRIENRGSKGGKNGIKGTYHLVKEPVR